MTAMTLRATAAAVLAATALMGIAAATEASATPVPQPQSVTAETRAAAARAASAPDTLATLSRFFAREGRIAPDAARPRIEGEPIPVNHLSPDFVAGKAGRPWPVWSSSPGRRSPPTGSRPCCGRPGPVRGGRS
ncbi:hypothetical protein ACU4GG_12040 [Streptomyces nojiriensis]